MIERRLYDKIQASMKAYPVVGIIGSRQAGKTTLAKMVRDTLKKKSIYLDLELPSDQDKLFEPELYLGQFADSLVIIDEIQRLPSLFPLLRALVDQRRVGGRFLILGSASPDLIRHASESLAGRIIYHELTPLRLEEIGYDEVNRLWLRGGYPLSYLAKSNDASFTWRDSFIKTYLEMDIPQLGIHVPSAQLRRFWTMLAHSHAQLWNANRIAGSMGLSAPTIRRYLDILEDTFIVRQLQPYHANLKKRLIKSPKIYIRDTGMLHSLLRIRTLKDLQDHPSAGSSWEGLVIEQALGILPEGWQAFFYRTSAGAEIDLLLLDDKNKPIAIEIKYSAGARVSRGFWNAFKDLSCTRGFVIYAGEEFYPITKNVYAVPLKDMEMIVRR
jgi:hypothetical protein